MLNAPDKSNDFSYLKYKNVEIFIAYKMKNIIEYFLNVRLEWHWEFFMCKILFYKITYIRLLLIYTLRTFVTGTC